VVSESGFILEILIPLSPPPVLYIGLINLTNNNNIKISYLGELGTPKVSNLDTNKEIDKILDNSKNLMDLP